MDRRSVSRGVGRRDWRRLGRLGWGSWFVGEGEAGCLGVLPLRRVGAEDEEAMGRNRWGRCVLLLIVWVNPRKKCRCHCECCVYVSVD